MNNKITISGKDVLTAKVVAVALLAGATLFFAILLVLMQITGTQKDSGIDPDLLVLLTGISSAYCLVSNCIGPIVQNYLMKSAMGRDDGKSNPMGVYFTGMIVRYAMAEGSAFFGLVSLLMGVVSNTYPAYLWLNTVPLGVLYMVVFLTFPTKNYVEEQLNRAWKSNPQT